MTFLFSKTTIKEIIAPNSFIYFYLLLTKKIYNAIKSTIFLSLRVQIKKTR